MLGGQPIFPTHAEPALPEEPLLLGPNAPPAEVFGSQRPTPPSLGRGSIAWTMHLLHHPHDWLTPRTGNCCQTVASCCVSWGWAAESKRTDPIPASLHL
jgi:hypothetical protein